MKFAALVVLVVGAPLARAGDGFSLLPPDLSLRERFQTEVPERRPAPTGGRFGAENSQWLTAGLGLAHDFSEATDYNLRFAWSQFLIDDVEFSVEGNLWYFDQEGNNAMGFNPALVFRWHFYNQGRASLYADLGVGLLVATEAVPEGATDFAFTPRAGMGMTYQLDPNDPMRLQLGVRWHHISNARITGDAKNPARDAPMFYAGVMFPF